MVKRQRMLSEGLLRDRTDSKISLSVRFSFNAPIFSVLIVHLLDITSWMTFLSDSCRAGIFIGYNKSHML